MNKKKIFLISLAHLSCDVNGGAIPAALPYLRSAYGFDYQAAGGLVLAYSCLSSLIQPLLGFIADKLKKPWFIPVGIALGGIGVSLIGFMRDYWAIFAAISLSGVGSAFFHPEGARLANKIAGNHKGIGLSLFSIGGNSGFIIGPLFVAFFLGHFGMKGTIIFGVTSLLMALIMLWVIFSPHTAHPAAIPPQAAEKMAEKSSDDPAMLESAELDEAPEEDAPKNNWPEFARLMGVIITRSVIFAGCNAFIPLYWVSVFGQSNAIGATVLVIFGIFGVGFNILGGIMSDKYGCVPVIRLCYTIMPLVVLGFSLVKSLALAWCFLPLLAFVIYGPFSSQVVQGQKLLAKNIGFASGITFGLATTLGGLAQPLLGGIADSYGLQTAFICLAGFAVPGACMSWLLSSGK